MGGLRVAASPRLRWRGRRAVAAAVGTSPWAATVGARRCLNAVCLLKRQANYVVAARPLAREAARERFQLLRREVGVVRVVLVERDGGSADHGGVA